MKDRVSGSGGYNTENGAKRYAVYDSASATTPSEYKFLLLDDNPTEAGTALNKANLLTDATGAKFCLDGTGTINDVINKIGAYTDVAVSATWTSGTLQSETVYYQDLTVSGVTTSSMPFLHSVTPPTTVVTEANVKAYRKQANKIFAYDVLEAGKIRLYSYADITVALVARFTNI